MVVVSSSVEAQSHLSAAKCIPTELTYQAGMAAAFTLLEAQSQSSTHRSTPTQLSMVVVSALVEALSQSSAPRSTPTQLSAVFGSMAAQSHLSTAKCIPTKLPGGPPMSMSSEAPSAPGRRP
jgi:hypothetical protein